MSEPADIAVKTVLALLIIANIAGNFLVCLVLKKNRDMRIPFNYLLVNLAVSDIVFAVFIAPVLILRETFIHPDEAIGSVLCKILTGGNVAWIGAYSSSLTLVVISVERFYAVASADSNATLTMSKVKMIIPTCWIIGALFNIPIFLFTTFDKTTDNCKWSWHERWMGVLNDTILLVLYALIPLLVMTFVYSKVVYMLWFKRNEQNELTYQQKGVLKVRKRVTLSVITVSAIFGACAITGSLTYLLNHFDIFIFGSVTYIVSDTLIMFNSAVNPYIYALLNELSDKSSDYCALLATHPGYRAHASMELRVLPTSSERGSLAVSWCGRCGRVRNGALKFLLWSSIFSSGHGVCTVEPPSFYSLKTIIR